MTRTATHVARKPGASTDHFAVVTDRGAILSACNGRSMGMAYVAPVTVGAGCGSCRKALAAGRIVLAAPVPA